MTCVVRQYVDMMPIVCFLWDIFNFELLMEFKMLVHHIHTIMVIWA
jgi:hypothetical protein